MPHKFQTRVVIPIEGVLRRIVSFNERSDGGVDCTNHINGFIHLTEGEACRIWESRYSISVDAKSECGTVHGTIEHSDGSKLERNISTNAIRDGRYQLILARSLDRPALLPRLGIPAKGPVVEVPSYDPARWALFYQLWFCSRETAKSFPIEGPFGAVRRDYRLLSLFMPVCYVPLPTQSVSTFVEVGMTAAEKQAEIQRFGGGSTQPAKGVTPQSLVSYVVWQFNKMMTEPFRCGFIGDEEPPLGHNPPTFFSRPACAK
jgi:hypothetical protein